MKRLAIVLLLLTASVWAQKTNVVYVDQFAGATVGARTTKAQTACRITVPCVLIFDTSLKNVPTGTMPARGANVAWLDWRTPGKMLYNGAEVGGALGGASLAPLTTNYGATAGFNFSSTAGAAGATGPLVNVDTGHADNAIVNFSRLGSAVFDIDKDGIARFYNSDWGVLRWTKLDGDIVHGAGTYPGLSGDPTYAGGGSFAVSHFADADGGAWIMGTSRNDVPPMEFEAIWDAPLGTFPTGVSGNQMMALFSFVGHQANPLLGLTPGMPIIGVNSDYHSNMFTIYAQGDTAFNGPGAQVGINNVPITFPATPAHTVLPLGVLEISHIRTDNAPANAVFDLLPQLVLGRGQNQTADFLQLLAYDRSTKLFFVDKDGDTNAASLQLSGGAEPACAAGNRGQLWYAPGAGGVKDTVNVCAKDAADAYAWRVIY